MHIYKINKYIYIYTHTRCGKPLQPSFVSQPSSIGPLVAHQASSLDAVELEVPQEPARAPFNWGHADLEPLREMLLGAQREGIFSPQPGLPL